MARASSTPAAPTKSRRETAEIMGLLFQQHPNAFTELDFRTPFELLVATILSAQSTDRRVNEVTPALFAKYPDARTLAQASQADLEREIKTTGFFRQKSKALLGMSQALVAEHGGEVPAQMDALVELPGVGRKTANVVLGHALGVPGLPVDRHVLRVANRIGIAQAAEPEEVEQQLCAAMPREQWTLTSDTLILHGRRICRPRPLCEQCAVVDRCDFARAWQKPTKAAVAGAPARRAKKKTTAAPAASVVRPMSDARPARAASPAAAAGSAPTRDLLGASAVAPPRPFVAAPRPPQPSKPAPGTAAPKRAGLRGASAPPPPAVVAPVLSAASSRPSLAASRASQPSKPARESVPKAPARETSGAKASRPRRSSR